MGELPFPDISEPRGPARDGDDAGARDIDEAQGFHKVDEGVEFLGRARHLEDEALDRRIDDAGAEDVGEPQRFDALVADARDLDEGELALDMRAFIGQIAHGMDRHEARELRLDLLDDHRRARGHDRDARARIAVVDLGHSQAFDVVAAAGEQSDDPGQYAGLVVDEHGDGMLLDGAHDGLQIGRTEVAQTRTMPSSDTGPLDFLSSGPSSISLCAAPEGIIGKQFSIWSTATST